MSNRMKPDFSNSYKRKTQKSNLLIISLRLVIYSVEVTGFSKSLRIRNSKSKSKLQILGEKTEEYKYCLFVKIEDNQISQKMEDSHSYVPISVL